MRKFISLVLALLCLCNVAFAQLKCEINECFELTSIVFRLAEAPEYVNKNLAGYSRDIDTYFVKYKDHKLIPFIKELRTKNGVSYDAVAAAAAFLEIKNGEVRVKTVSNILKISQIEPRWPEKTFQIFVSYLNDFYKKTKFNKFYLQQANLYNTAVERMNERLKDLQLDWFQFFLGKGQEKTLVVVSLCNGAHNYAFQSPDKAEGIVIGCGSDAGGLPVYHKNIIFIVMHELLHGYINPRIANCWNQINTASQKIYSYVKEDMRKLAYTNAQTTINEWLINLLTIMYLEAYPIPNLSVDFLLKTHQSGGFIWMERSFMFMQHFSERRNQFATIDDYMPQIVSFINYTANHFDQVINEYSNRCPYIIDVFPVSGSTIPLGVDTITVRFSEPMLESHGMKPIDDNKISEMPISQMPFWQEVSIFKIAINKNELDKNKTYGFRLIRTAFQSTKYYPIKEDYIYTFNTNE
ncbi:MAG: DUF4932 domain-containing protein [Bacteroidales bacterium]